MKPRSLAFVVTMIVGVVPATVSLQQAAPSLAASPGSTALDNPRSAAYGFIVASRAGEYQRAASYLDLSELPESERAEQGPLLARELKVVLDQKLWLDFEAISDRPDGTKDDGLTEDRERLGSIPTRQGNMDINLRRTVGPDGHQEWRFSPATIDRLAVLSEEYGHGPLLARWLPDWSTRMRVWQLEGWQWVGLGVFFVLGLALARVVRRALYRVIVRFTPRTDPSFRESILRAVSRPAGLIIALLIFSLATILLRLSVPARHLVFRIELVAGIVVVSWALVELADRITAGILSRLTREDRRAGVGTVVLMRRLSKSAVIAVAAVAILQNLGFNVTAVFAGLGIGGIAVALAAQKTLENLFGGVMLTTDHPIRIGDLCRFGDKQGVVEEIGLRSTRIRTLDRTVITVPNGELSSVQIENFALRDRIRILATLALRAETTPAQVREVLERVRQLLVENDRIERDTLRVRLVALGAHSRDVEVVAYVLTSDYDLFLAIREELLLRIMDIVAESGAGFARPAQTIYVGEDPSGSLTKLRSP